MCKKKTSSLSAFLPDSNVSGTFCHQRFQQTQPKKQCVEMDLYGGDVRELIGEDIEEYLLDSIYEGYIDLQKAEIFTEVLSECDRDCECKSRAIKGKFLNRTQKAKFKFEEMCSVKYF